MFKDIADNYDGVDKEEFKNILENTKYNLTLIQSYYFNIMKEKKQLYDDLSSPYAKFGWVRRLGYALIEYCAIDIGGYTIDTQYGEWMNIWNELTIDHTHEKNYFKMIGDISQLYNFNRDSKPSYLVKIPLNFWFSRFNGLSLPIIALENADVIFKLKIRALDEVAYIEEDTTIKIDGVAEGLTLRDLEVDEIIKIDANLYTDYIFLGTDERRRFAQVSNEYLIETVQMEEYDNIHGENFEVELDFIHPCKALFWTIQKNSYRKNNENGSSQCRWDNYTSNTDKKGNPIKNTEIFFHGLNRNEIFTDSTNVNNDAFHNKKYYSYLQSNRYFNRTPDDGINVYSFGLYPAEYQPSGQCNMGRLSSVKMKFLFDTQLFTDDDTATLRIYALNYNILRFIGGFGGLAFSNR
jgi:hypothetical protein